MNRPPQVLLAAGVIVAAGVLGFASYRWFASRPVEPTVVSLPLAAPEPPQPEQGTVPRMLPSFSLEDRDGRLRSIGEWKGKSLVINFWATWCAPCRREIPMLKSLHAARASQGIEVVGIAVDVREDVLEYANAIGIDYPVLIGEQDGLEAVESFGMGAIAFPFTVFTDRRGRIVTAHLGELHAAEANAILDEVVAVNMGRIPLDEAQRNISEALDRLEDEEANAESAAQSPG